MQRKSAVDCRSHSPPPPPPPPPAACCLRLPRTLPCICTLYPTPLPDDDAQARADELCALEAIYGEGFVRVLDSSPAAAPSSIAVTLPEPGAQPCLQLRAHLPDSYPSQHPPVFELGCELLPPDVLGSLATELEGLFSPGARSGSGRL